MKNVKNFIDSMRGGELVFLAGRESMGKTRLALDMVNYLTVKKGVPCFYHVEGESIEQIEEMLIEIGGKTDSKLPLYINDDIWIGREELYDLIREHKEKYGIKFVVIDDFYGITGFLLPEFGEQGRIETAADLKKLAGELDITFLVIDCLDREVDRRQDKRPVITDLGVVQNLADTILFLYRDECYDANTPKPETAEIIVAKNRSGDVGTIELGFANGRFFHHP